jgi:hypothetical protein
MSLYWSHIVEILTFQVAEDHPRGVYHVKGKLCNLYTHIKNKINRIAVTVAYIYIYIYMNFNVVV